MAKKLSEWFRIFIVFAVVWTVGSINLFYLSFPKESKERLEKIRDLICLLAKEKSEKEKIEGNFHRQIYEYHKARRKAIYLFPLYWLAPIGLVYCLRKNQTILKNLIIK
jgi:hypothetical protein